MLNEQVAITFQFNHSTVEVSKRINDTLAAEPSWKVQTMSIISYDTAAGRAFDAVVVFDISHPQDLRGIPGPRLAGDVWDNGYRFPLNKDPVPCAKGEE